jgi:hypothetical protein
MLNDEVRKNSNYKKEKKNKVNQVNQLNPWHGPWDWSNHIESKLQQNSWNSISNKLNFKGWN